MGGCYSLEGVVPVVHPAAFVHPDATLIGDVHVGPRCFIGPFASLRGDFGRIEVREGSNVQDSCVLHCFPGRRTLVDVDGHIGHGAVLHGCEIGAGALIGINAVVMDGVTVGRRAMVGAHSFVKSGFEVPDRTLVNGSPARIVRELSDDELAWKANGTTVYQELAARYLRSFQPATPLPEAEPDRPSLGIAPERARTLQEYRGDAAAR